jgi:GNAT superfamily N-acetyltransferase
MITIRPYREDDAETVGRLIAETYTRYNLDFFPAEARAQFLGPFQHAGSDRRSHRAAIAEVIRAATVLVAEEDGEIVGVLRGRAAKLQSLFVRGDRHRQGIGRRLVARFEQLCLADGARTIKVQSTLYAVPFYTALGYKKTTGVRRMTSFDGEGLPYQPMKKTLP